MRCEVVAAAAFISAAVLSSWRARCRRNGNLARFVSGESFSGRCYCGKICFAVRRDATVIRSAYCHCESCRRAHSAPLYEVCYVNPGDMAIICGSAYLKRCRMRRGGYRDFCSECGSRIRNDLEDDLGRRIGFFPNTLQAQFLPLPARFRPTLHHCPEEAVIPLPNDGLIRQPNRYAKAETESCE